MGKNSTSGEKTQQAGDEKTKEEVKSEDQRLCELSSDGFIKRFKIANILHNCGALKEKGVPAIEIFTYMFNQMFSPLSMYSQMKLGIFHEGFRKNTVYRFLEEACMNWHKAVLLLANSIIQVVALLTSGSSGRFALVIDDTPLKKCGRKMELVSKYYNHVSNTYEYGYRILTLAWTDGVTTIPVRYTLLASPEDGNVRGRIDTEIDGRTLAGKIRSESRTSMTELVIDFVRKALKSGVRASAVLFDSGFAYPRTIISLVRDAGITVITRLKTDFVQYYEFNGELKTIRDIYRTCRKRCGKAAWKLSVRANLLVREDGEIKERLPVKLVFVPNRSKRDEWICLLCTDVKMEETEIIRQYGKRWNIEVVFKCCKQYLKFGKDFHSTSFEGQNAQIAIALMRYMFIELAKRESEDEKAFGELFLHGCQDMQDITLGQSVGLIMSLFADAMKSVAGLTDEQVEKVKDYVVSAMPGYLLRTLSLANGIRQAA